MAEVINPVGDKLNISPVNIPSLPATAEGSSSSFTPCLSNGEFGSASSSSSSTGSITPTGFITTRAEASSSSPLLKDLVLVKKLEKENIEKFVHARLEQNYRLASSRSPNYTINDLRIPRYGV